MDVPRRGQGPAAREVRHRAARPRGRTWAAAAARGLPASLILLLGSGCSDRTVEAKETSARPAAATEATAITARAAAPREGSAVEASETRSATTRPRDPLAAEIFDARTRFYTGDPTDHAARREDYSVAVASARSWIESAALPLDLVDLEIAREVQLVAETLRGTVGGWTDEGDALAFDELWINLLRSDVIELGAVGPRLYGYELSCAADLIGDLLGLAAMVDQLDDDSIGLVSSEDLEGKCACWILRANGRRLLGRFEAAFEDLGRADSALGAIENPEELWDSRCRALLLLELDLGRLDRAKACLSPIQAYAARSNDLLMELDTKELTALYLVYAGKYDAAHRLATRALAEVSELKRTDVSIEKALGGLRTLQAVAVSRESESFKALASARSSLRQLLEDESSPSLELLMLSSIELAALELKLDEPEAATHVLDELEARLEEAQVPEASGDVLRTRVAARRFEIAKWMYPWEAEERRRAAEVLREEFSGLLDAWNDLDDIPGGVGFLHYHERLRILSLLIDETLDGSSSGAQAALDLVLLADACSSVAQRFEAGPCRSRDLVRDCGSSGHAVIVLVPTPESTHRFFVDASGVTHEHVSDAAVLQELADPILAALRAQPDPSSREGSKHPAEAELSSLAHELIPPHLRENPARYRAVHVIGAGMTGLMPIEVLPLEDGRPLGLSIPVARIPSAAAARAIRSRRRSSGRTTLAMFALGSTAAIRTGIDLTPEEVARLESAAGCEIAFESTAPSTRESFFRSARRGAELFVAWSHGLNDYAAPIPAGLLVLADSSGLGEDAVERRSKIDVPTGTAFLGGLEIERALARALPEEVPDAVFLAACNTALGHLRVGDESASHLGGVFLGAGSRFAIVADRPVERSAAFAFLESFCEHYVAGAKTAGEAILAARSQLASQERFADPHYWAAFQLLGETQVERN